MFRRGCTGSVLMVGTLALLTGCTRSLTIHQDPVINTAIHADRAPDQRSGGPLDLAIVCVYADDLKKPSNALLKPDSRITARDWYNRRPTLKERGGKLFDLPAKQLYLLTDEKDSYGQWIGTPLRGATLDGAAPIHKKGIKLKWGRLGDDQTVLYVFPRFIGPDGAVLPVAPARFCPPGAYPANLEIKVGVRADRRVEEAQYIEILSKR